METHTDSQLNDNFKGRPAFKRPEVFHSATMCNVSNCSRQSRKDSEMEKTVIQSLNAQKPKRLGLVEPV